MKITVLGCGVSTGVPAIGIGWGDCDPADPRNRRRRASLFVEARGSTILIDTSPDLREQFLDAGITHVDAIAMTHAHADHLHGIDDLRAVNRLMNKPIPLYADPTTLAEIRQRFGYVLADDTAQPPFYRAALIPREIAGRFEAAGVPFIPFAQNHGYSTTLGFRIGAFAYSTDVTELDDAAFAALAGTEVWIVDCLRHEPHPTHSHVAKTIEWVTRVKPRRAILTHMDHTLDYETLAAELPIGIEPGRDGLVIELPDP
ncbi:MAG TPA: MBL fold metallo-hydrolase [Stellaceae bacterium]|jgi:phosphoribosyl 1,2-cyclic phosphate phosphodiesterase